MERKYGALVLLGVLITLASVASAEEINQTTSAGQAVGRGMLESIGINGNALAVLGAAIGVALAGLGAAKGLEIAGSTAAAVVGENENNFSAALTIGVMPQTQVIYAFIVGMLIILGLMSKEMTMEQGWFCVGAGLAVGIAGFTAINQGKVASAAIGAAAKNPSVKGKSLIFVVLPEAAALFGFVTGILLLVAGGVF